MQKAFQDNFLREVYIENCNCDNRNPQCKIYYGPVERVNHISLEIIHLIRECLSDDLKERLQRQLVGKIIQIVEGLPAIKITDNHVNDNVICRICLIGFNVAEDPCHLPCDRGHIFHRN